MSASLYNLARMHTATLGTGSLVDLGNAVTGFLSFANAGVTDGVTVSYAINDPRGGGSEVGSGVYHSLGPSFTRTTVEKSSDGTSRISLSVNAEIMISPSAADMEILYDFVRTSTQLTLSGKRLKINANGIAEPQLHVVSDDGANQASINTTTYGISGGTFHGRHANGTEASPTATLAGNIIGGYGVRAYYSGAGGGFQISSPASIHGVASEDQTSTAFGMYWRFLTTPKGSTTRQERVIIADNGTLWAHDTATFDPKSDAQTLPLGAAGGGQCLVSAGAANATFAAVGYNNGAGYRAGAAGGTPASPSAIGSGALLAFLGGHGHDGSAFTTTSKALITLKAAENFSPTNQGTTIGFEVTTIGSTTRGEVLKLDEKGMVAKGAAAIPAGGTAGVGYRFSSTANFGVFFGSGLPTLSAARGSLYLRSDGAPSYNSDGATTWKPIGIAYNVEDYGAVGDAVGPITVAMTNTSKDCTRSSGSWVNADIGKLIVVAGTGAGGGALSTTIASISSTTVAVLTVAASTTNASTSAWYGTNNATAINAVWALARTTGGHVSMGLGTFAFDRLTLHNAIGVTLEGLGKQSGSGPTDYGTHLWCLADLNSNDGNAIDFTGNSHCTLRNFQLHRGDITNYINVGILIAAKSGTESIANSFEDLLVFGFFLKAGIYQYGVPNCTYHSCQSYTYASDANAYAAQFTCNNHASVTSANNTLNTGPIDTSNIYMENCHWIEFAVPSGTSSSRACRINGVDGFEFTNGFLGSTLACLHVKDTSSNWGSRNVEIRNTTLQGFPLGGGLYGTPTYGVHFDSAETIYGFALMRIRANEASTAHNTTNAAPSTSLVQFAATPPKVIGLRIEGAPVIATAILNGGGGTQVSLDGAYIEANGAALNEPGSVVRSIYVNAGAVTLQSGATSARYGRVVKKAGSAGGNYGTSATHTTIQDVDATNLAFTTIIPAGMALRIEVTATIGNSTAGDGVNMAIDDGGTIVTAGDFTSPANGQVIAICIGTTIAGDDASHTIKLRWQAITGGAGIMRNSSAADAPKMIFTYLDGR